jgi:hypothetical protein
LEVLLRLYGLQGGIQSMPVSKNPKFYYLLYGEAVDFRLASFDVNFIDDRRQIKQLAVPIPTHISDKPFRGTNMKTQTCAGADRCALCFAKHRPTNLWPVHILVGDKEHIYDMPPSAHSALLEKTQELLDNGATDDDLINADFRLQRLSRGEKPFFICSLIQGDTSEKTEENAEADIKLNEEDMFILEQMDTILRTREIKDTRGSVIKTLREKYDWPDVKITLAFETVLDENGFLKEKTKL